MFEKMATKIEKIKMAENLRYAICLQFLERLENCGKKNVVECMTLRDVIDDVNGSPKVGNTIELMKKELRKMKIVENHKEPLKKESKTYYVHNNEDNRSR